MRKIFFLYIILFYSIPSAQSNVSKPIELLKKLHSNSDWRVIDDRDGMLLSTKIFDDLKLSAFMVQKKISIPSNIIKKIIMDVDNYDAFFNSTKSFESIEINRNEKWKDCYNFLPVALPFIKDREYYFRIHPFGIYENDNLSLVHWYLIKENELRKNKFRDTKRDAVYLDYGAGLWMSEMVSENVSNLSYRLYMDPGGSLPDFAVDIINKVSIFNIFQDVLLEAERVVKISLR